MAAVITLTTDFQEDDGYVAAMKGVILSINPDVKLIDISHRIAPHDIKDAAFILSTVVSFFPSGTIHLVVVDPGVGTGRKAVILNIGTAYFVAPDNGVLSYIISEFKDSGLKAVTVSNTEYRRPEVSRTFHGRDIFAPAAAYLSLGIPMEMFGEPLGSLNTFPVPFPYQEADGGLTGEVLHIDSFGNLITNIRERNLPEGKLIVEIADRNIPGLSRSYQEGGRLLAIIGGSGYLEIALKEGNASKYLKAKTGVKIYVRPE